MTQQFEFQPTLAGPRVTVRPLRNSDWDELFDAASDPRIWEQHPASDRYLEPIFRAYFDDAMASGSAFAFCDNASQRLIGSSRYYGFDAEASEIEIGWTFLARDYWGGSFNAEIKQLMLGHAFRFVNCVVFWVGEDNVRSRKAVEKIGGVLRDSLHYRPEGGDAANVIYEVFRP